MTAARPYIAYELDALQAAPDVARAAGIPEDAVVAGNVRMWHACWRAKADRVTGLQIAGFYGSASVVPALLDWGFLEPIEGGFRVRGAARYLRLAEGRSRGGRAASGNLRRGTQPGPAAVVSREGSRENPAGSSPADPRLDPGPSTEHRTASIEQRASLPPANSRPKTPEEEEVADCWEMIQQHRREADLVEELVYPRGFTSFVAKARAEFSQEQIATAHVRFLKTRDFGKSDWATAVFVLDAVFRQRAGAPRKPKRNPLTGVEVAP